MTATDTTLDDYLTDLAAPSAEPVTDEARARWSIDGSRTAGWALRRLAHARAAAARVNTAADDRIAEINQWRTQATAGPTRDAEFFEGALIDWHRRTVEPDLAEGLDRYLDAHPDADPDEALTTVWARVADKSAKLPDGTVAARKTSAGVEVVDADAVVAWALEAGVLEVVATKPKVAELAKLARTGVVVVSADGEAVPGVIPRAGRISYSVKVDTSLERPAWEPLPGAD